MFYFSEKLPKDITERFDVLAKKGITPLYTLHQDHGDEVVINPNFQQDDCYPQDNCRLQDDHGDAIVTNKKGLFIGVKTADCVPILLYDDVAKVCGAVHAGWRSTALGIARKTSLIMQKDFDSKPENIQVKIGPCICKKCFQTKHDVVDAMPVWADEFIAKDGQEHFFVDLVAINKKWLELAGVFNVELPTECTCCNPEKYWSHRKHGQNRGTQISAIGIM